MKKELNKPSLFRDYIDLSIDVAKMQAFMLNNITASSEEKDIFEKEVFNPLLKRIRERLDFVEQIQKRNTERK